MVFPVSDAQQAAFLGSHEMQLMVTVLRGSESLGDIEVVDANVSATYATRGGRDAWITVDRSVIQAGLLDPNSDEVVIRTGIPGVVAVPLFTGRVDEVEEDSDGSVRVQLLSRGAEAIRAQFEVPWVAGPAGTAARAEIMRILQSINPMWGVNTDNANDNTIPANLVWEIDPGQALDQLAQGASLIWQPDRVGSFDVYSNPWYVGTTAPSVLTLFEGQDGVLVEVRANRSRIGVYNSVTVVTERVNNTAPVRVTFRDDNPSSPTFWGGLFGKQNLVVKNQTPEQLGNSSTLALRILRQSLALRRSFVITVPDMPLLDPGDVFTLWYQDVVYALVVESVDYSVRADQPTRITARELNTEIGVEV